MTREKVAPSHLIQSITYTESIWKILKKKRLESLKIFEVLEKFNVFIHGSIARGDVHKNSDIDFIIPNMIKEFELIQPLDSIGISSFQERKLIQATPLSAIKATLTLTEDISITFPLIPFYPREFQFYKFGGQIDLKALKEDKRVPGINKKLVFILPNENGHDEFGVNQDNASIYAKQLDISIDTILERIRVLNRRDKVGRTGIYYHKILTPDESFGKVLKQLQDKNAASKRRIKRKKI